MPSKKQPAAFPVRPVPKKRAVVVTKKEAKESASEGVKYLGFFRDFGEFVGISI
jgi:hypothetical protein